MVEQVRAFALQSMAQRSAVGLAPRVDIVVGALDRRLRLAPCRRVEPHLPQGARAWGRTRVGVRCVDGPVRWNVFIPVTVKVWARALVAAAPLPAGTVLARDHLHPTEVDLTLGTAPPLTDLSQALGRTLAQPLRPGDAVAAIHLRAREWFAAGDTVHLLARGPGYAVGAQGQALAPGTEGRPVRVRTTSGRIVLARPVAERRAELVL